VTAPYACDDETPTVGTGATITADANVTITGATAVCTGCAAGYPLGSTPDTLLSIQYLYTNGIGSR
jgi:hypothetical protein